MLEFSFKFALHNSLLKKMYWKLSKVAPLKIYDFFYGWSQQPQAWAACSRAGSWAVG